MLVEVYCNKCGDTGKLDIGDMTKEQTIETLKNWDTFNCFGNHVELSSPIKYWDILWGTIEEAEVKEVDFIRSLKHTYTEVYTTDELQEKYVIVNFAYGMCVTKSKDTNIKKAFDFVTAPSGKRYYIG